MSKNIKRRNKKYNPYKSSGSKMSINAFTNYLWFNKFDRFLESIKEFGTCDYIEDEPVWIDKSDGVIHPTDSLFDLIIGFFEVVSQKHKINIAASIEHLKYLKKALNEGLAIQQKYIDKVVEELTIYKKILSQISRQEALTIMEGMQAKGQI